MSSPHSIRFHPEPARPIGYRARTPRWLKVSGLVAAAALASVIGTVVLIAALDADEARLDAAFVQGMAVGQLTCGRR